MSLPFFPFDPFTIETSTAVHDNQRGRGDRHRARMLGVGVGVIESVGVGVSPSWPERDDNNNKPLVHSTLNV